MSKKFVFTALLAFVVSTLLSAISFADCSGQRASADPRVKGHVFFSTGENCLMNGNQKTCVGSHEKLVDTCKSKAVVTKFGCQGDEPTMLEMNCPSGTSCQDGACQ